MGKTLRLVYDITGKESIFKQPPDIETKYPDLLPACRDVVLEQVVRNVVDQEPLQHEIWEYGIHDCFEMYFDTNELTREQRLTKGAVLDHAYYVYKVLAENSPSVPEGSVPEDAIILINHASIKTLPNQTAMIIEATISQ